MKLVKLPAIAVIAAFTLPAFFSCNNGAQSSSTTDTAKNTAAKDTAATVAAPPPPPAFVPFNVAEVTHAVKDYAKWRPVFDADSVNRKTAGMETIVVGQEIDHPNNILLVFKIDDVQKVKDFAASPKLKAAMAKGGVSSKPVSGFWHIIRLNPGSHEKQWVEIDHKVKDFDAWVKVYDGEGKEKRMSEGMVDEVMARSFADSNMVKLVFDITDLARAKAAITSAAKKKLMMDAGVIGVPKIVFYKEADPVK